MATGCFVYITAKGTFAGQTCENQFFYYSPTEIPGLTSMIAANAFYDQVWAEEWQPLVSESFMLLEVQAIVFQADQANNSPQYIKVTDEIGLVTGEALGPNIVVNLLWIPDNDELYPDEYEAFGQGRSGLSGIPESQQDDGLLTDAALEDWQDAAQAFASVIFTVGGTPYDLPLALQRQPKPNATPPITYPYAEQPRVPIAAAYAGQKLGTRNSRKR